MPFDAVIAGFAAALEDSAAPPPATVLGRRGAPDGRRFSIYRNNVAVGLIGALAARYPVTLATLGAETFRDLARVFAQARKPRSPVMIAYGAEFPDFLQEAAPDLAAPGVVEVARLENAWVEAYHAEEAPAATLADLAALEPGRIARARVAPHPAARLLRFATMAASVWASRQTEASPSTTLRVVPLPRNAGEDGEDALITRPEADVRVRILPSGGYAFAQALLEGAMLAEAAEALGELEDFGTHLVGLVEAGAFQSILPGDPS